MLRLKWPLTVSASKVQRLSLEDCCCAHYCLGGFWSKKNAFFSFSKCTDSVLPRYQIDCWVPCIWKIYAMIMWLRVFLNQKKIEWWKKSFAWNGMTSRTCQECLHKFERQHWLCWCDSGLRGRQTDWSSQSDPCCVKSTLPSSSQSKQAQSPDDLHGRGEREFPFINSWEFPMNL